MPTHPNNSDNAKTTDQNTDFTHDAPPKAASYPVPPLEPPKRKSLTEQAKTDPLLDKIINNPTPITPEEWQTIYREAHAESMRELGVEQRAQAVYRQRQIERRRVLDRLADLLIDAEIQATTLPDGVSAWTFTFPAPDNDRRNTQVNPDVE